MCVWFAYEMILSGFFNETSLYEDVSVFWGLFLAPYTPPNDQNLLDILNFCVLICEILDYYKIEKIKSRWSGMPGFAILLRLNNYSKLY